MLQVDCNYMLLQLNINY